MEYVLNPIFGSGKFTNKELLEMARTNGLINDRDYDIIAKHLKQNPQFADDYNWSSGDPNKLAAGIDNKISEQFSMALGNLWGSVYTTPSMNPSANPSQHSMYIDAQGNFNYPQVDYSTDGRQVVDFAKAGYGTMLTPQQFQAKAARAGTPAPLSVTPAAPNYPYTTQQGGLLGPSSPPGGGLLNTNFGQQTNNMNNSAKLKTAVQPQMDVLPQRNPSTGQMNVPSYNAIGPGGRQSPMGPHQSYTGDNSQPYYGMGPQIPLSNPTSILDMGSIPGATLFNRGGRAAELQQIHRPVYGHYATNEAQAWGWGGPQVIDRGDESYYFQGIGADGRPRYSSPSTGSSLNRSAWEAIAKQQGLPLTSDVREPTRTWQPTAEFSQALRGLLG